MIPLQQWVCDGCGLLIEKPGDGWLEWLSGEEGDARAHDFRIVHWGGKCYRHDGKDGCSDGHLTHFVGDYLPAFYNILGVGHRGLPRPNTDPKVRSMAEFAEVLWRLSIPYYEEARLYFEEAGQDDFFGGINQVDILSTERLQQIIRRYA